MNIRLSERERDKLIGEFCQCSELAEIIEQTLLNKVVKTLEKLNKYRVFGFEDGTLLLYKEDWKEIKNGEKPPVNPVGCGGDS